MSEEHEIDLTAEVKVEHSGLGWGLAGVVLLIAILADWYWIKRVDCALGVRQACAEIEKIYPAPRATPPTQEPR